MVRLTPVLLAASAALLAVACSPDLATTPTTTTTTSTAPSFSKVSDDNAYSELDNSNDRHVHELRGNDAAKNAGRKGGGSPGTGIYYHGGPVLRAATTVVAVYWASAPIYSGGPAAGSTGSAANDGSLVGFFLRGLGGSPYFNINTTYTDGSGAAIANVVNYAGFWANNTSVPVDGHSVSDASMLTMLQGGFTSGALSYDPNTLYLIFTADKVNLGGGFGTQYCAYHTHGTVTIGGVRKTVLYAALPYDNAYPGACTNATKAPNGDAGADAEVNTLAHETEETTTDMLGTAWFDNSGNESADKCAWNWGTTYTTANGGVANIKVGGKDFLVQQNWVNSGSGGCLQHWP